MAAYYRFRIFYVIDVKIDPSACDAVAGNTPSFQNHQQRVDLSEAILKSVSEPSARLSASILSPAHCLRA